MAIMTRLKTGLHKALASLFESRAETARMPVVYHDLDHLAGFWTKEEEAEFEKALDAQRMIDERLWEKQSSP
jgi:hypothetical protein